MMPGMQLNLSHTCLPHACLPRRKRNHQAVSGMARPHPQLISKSWTLSRTLLWPDPRIRPQ
jgi:hypothetical protein